MFFKLKAGQVPGCICYCFVDDDSRNNMEWYAPANSSFYCTILHLNQRILARAGAHTPGASSNINALRNKTTLF